MCDSPDFAPHVGVDDNSFRRSCGFPADFHEAGYIAKRSNVACAAASKPRLRLNRLNTSRSLPRCPSFKGL